MDLGGNLYAEMFKMMGFSIATVLIMCVLILLVAGLIMAGMAACFAKAGVHPAWALCPNANSIYMFLIGGVRPIQFLLVLLMLVPVIGVIIVWVLMIVWTWKFYRAYGCGTGMCILGLFLPMIALPIVGFSKRYCYIGTYMVAPYGSGNY